jgi:hypothetical protein
MVGFARTLLKRLEYKLRGDLASFVLMDGSTHYFNPGGGELFLHTTECIRADYAGRPRPAPTATLLALCKARDRESAVTKVATSRLFPYDRAVLIEHGELVAPRSVASPPRKDFPE